MWLKNTDLGSETFPWNGSSTTCIVGCTPKLLTNRMKGRKWCRSILMLLINHLKIRGGTMQTLHVRQKGCCYKYRLYAGERFPKSSQDLRSPSIFASGILVVIQIPDLNMTKGCEGSIQWVINADFNLSINNFCITFYISLRKSTGMIFKCCISGPQII